MKCPNKSISYIQQDKMTIEGKKNLFLKFFVEHASNLNT
jgi:hypothetical protein